VLDAITDREAAGKRAVRCIEPGVSFVAPGSAGHEEPAPVGKAIHKAIGRFDEVERPCKCWPFRHAIEDGESRAAM
jgi:hypothetical protein